MKLTLNLNPPQIRILFKSISHRAFYGTYFKAIKEKFKEQGLFKQMLVDAYGDRLPAKMLEELYDAGWLQLEHVVAATMDESFCDQQRVSNGTGTRRCGERSMYRCRNRFVAASLSGVSMAASAMSATRSGNDARLARRCMQR